MKKKSIKIILIIAAIVVAIFILKDYFQSKKFEYAGTVEATKIDISSQLSSLLTHVNVYEGDRISANQILAVLECKDVKLSEQIASINYNRNQSLYNTGTVSKDTLDQFENTKESSDVRVSWCNLISPITGTVLNRYHEPGELAQPGTKVLTVANIKDVYAYIYVPQPDVAEIKIGQTIRATLPELDDKEFIGRVIKVNDEAEFTPKNVQTKNERERLIYGIKISFLGVNDEEILKPGMTIYVDSLKPVKQ